MTAARVYRDSPATIACWGMGITQHRRSVATIQMLMNLLLLRAGYPPALLLQEWRLGYLEALSQADRGRYNPLLNLVGRAVEILERVL